VKQVAKFASNRSNFDTQDALLIDIIEKMRHKASDSHKTNSKSSKKRSFYHPHTFEMFLEKKSARIFPD
jgi:hypothetical protein